MGEKLDGLSTYRTRQATRPIWSSSTNAFVQGTVIPNFSIAASGLAASSRHFPLTAILRARPA